MPETIQTVKTFLDREWLATLATVNAKNEPRAVPVFFTYDDGKMYVQTDRTSVKVRNLQKNCHVAVTVYCGEEAVVINGTARIVDDEEFVTRTQEHIAKYGLRLDEQGKDSMGIPLFDSKVRCVVEISPKRTIFW